MNEQSTEKAEKLLYKYTINNSLITDRVIGGKIGNTAKRSEHESHTTLETDLLFFK